jgi:uncharacterized pyridoxamine 5'-phosphate oxidase family protein/NAD-dependent dihydropyrimidine dehydrogenase PreA subunit
MGATLKKAFELLEDAESVAFATLNNGNADVRMINVMLIQEDGLYFITARGKAFYHQLKQNPAVSVCSTDANYVSVRINGEIKFCEDKTIAYKIFEHNPDLGELYPDGKRDIMEAFHMYKGKGEIFDISKIPLIRSRFAFGGASVNPPGIRITGKCNACGICKDSCPVDIISEGDVFSIDGIHCLECGRCIEICPEEAIMPAMEM